MMWSLKIRILLIFEIPFDCFSPAAFFHATIKKYEQSYLDNWIFEEFLWLLFHNFLLLMVQNLSQSSCIFSFTKILFLFPINARGARGILCLKEIDSVQFLLFTIRIDRIDRKMENWMLKISERGYLYHTWSRNGKITIQCISKMNFSGLFEKFSIHLDDLLNRSHCCVDPDRNWF